MSTSLQKRRRRVCKEGSAISDTPVSASTPVARGGLQAVEEEAEPEVEL